MAAAESAAGVAAVTDPSGTHIQPDTTIMKHSARSYVRTRLLASRLSSLLLLLQRSPLVQMLFPEARLLGGAGLGEMTKWSVTVIAGLGAYDTVSGASTITQLTPDPKSSTVSSGVGQPLSFTFQYGGSDTVDHFQIIGTIPAGLKQTGTREARTDTLSGVPTVAGTYPIKIKAWRDSSENSDSVSASFTIKIGSGDAISLPAIVTQPKPITVNPGSRARLKVTATGPGLTYQWYKGRSGVTTQPVNGAKSPTFKTPALKATTRYWVRVTNASGSTKSKTVTVTVR